MGSFGVAQHHKGDTFFKALFLKNFNFKFLKKQNFNFYVLTSDNFYYQEVEIVHLNDWLIGGLHYVT